MRRYDNLSSNYPRREKDTRLSTSLNSIPISLTPPRTVTALGRALIAPNTDFARSVVMGNDVSVTDNPIVRRKNEAAPAPPSNDAAAAKPVVVVSNLSALLNKHETASQSQIQPIAHYESNDRGQRECTSSSNEADSASGPPPPPPTAHLGSSAPDLSHRRHHHHHPRRESRQHSAENMQATALLALTGSSADRVRRCISSKELGTLAPPSGSPYAYMLHQKEELETRMRERLQALREHPIDYIDRAASQEQSGSSHTSGRGGSNQLRNIRRAEHTQAVVNDLCDVVADLFIAESKLLKPLHYGVPDHVSANLKRDHVSKSIHAFVSALPVRYALGADTPSEVLLHMRLMAAARSNKTKAAVHIHNLEEDEGGQWSRTLTSPGNLRRCRRLVTISCRDTSGLLELITKNLGTGGSRVLDADVMLSSDGIVLDRFVVEMNGRLRLDKLANLIEAFLLDAVDGEDGVADGVSGVTEQASPTQSASSNEAHGPLYYKAATSPEKVTPKNLREEMETAVPFVDFLASSSQGQLTFPIVPTIKRTYSLPARASSGTRFSSFQLPMRYSDGDGVPIAASPDPRVEHDIRPNSMLPPLVKSLSMRERRPLVNRRAAPDLDQLVSNDPPADETVEETERKQHAIDYVTIPSAEIGHGAENRVIPLIPFEELMLIETIGTGRVSTIYRAAWQLRAEMMPSSPAPLNNVQMVALKVAMVNPATGDVSHVDELRREADIAARLGHPNICGLVGVAADTECFCLAYDFCEGGSLLSLLTDSTRYYEYLPIALDVANGMAYLHSRNVIHRDLKPSNILLTRDHRAKIADFGMSVANTGQELTAETGTYRYMAPEVIRHESYSSNADVYSFGLCLWQLITREVPFATMTPIQAAYAVAEGKRPDVPDTTPRRLREIILACWDQDSHKRPSFTYITMALADYAKMAFSPANVGALTLQIANEMLANVHGNSTVNVDFTTPVSLTSPSFYIGSDYSYNDSNHSNVGLEI